MQKKKSGKNKQAVKVMKDLGAEDLDFSKLSKISLGIIIGGIALIAVLSYSFKWLGTLAGIAVIAIAVAIFIKKIADKQKVMVTAYKTLGMTKEEYAASFDRIELNKYIKYALISLWEKTPDPEKVIAMKGKAREVGQSKQNKKKRKPRKK